MISTMHVERRSKRRFPIHMPAYWCIPSVGLEGAGNTLNISSSGLWLTDVRVPQECMGCNIMINLEWPALLDGSVPLQVSFGCIIVRVEGAGCGLKYLTQPKFRTMARARMVAAQVVEQMATAQVEEPAA